MSQNDLSIANQGFASFRSDLNSALQALGSTNSGTSAPSTTYANQLFYDTTNNILKIRNEDNDAFISLFTLDQTNDNIEALTIDGTLTYNGDLVSSTAGTSSFRAGVNAGNSITSGGNFNVTVGDEAGTAITSGASNTLVGYASGDAITTATNNVAVGTSSLTTNILSSKNVALGVNALKTHNQGSATESYNVAVGHNAGESLTTGIKNTLVGGETADAQTTATANTGVGYGALGANTTGGSNVAVGENALGNYNVTDSSESFNVALGYRAGLSVSTGVQNTLIGSGAGDALTDADFNIAIGTDALGADTLGSRNVAIGRRALLAQNFTSATDAYNVAVGFEAGNDITTGTNNTLIGANAGDALTEASASTAVGQQALSACTTNTHNTAVGTDCLLAATGGFNTAIGTSSGSQITSGTKNSILGMYNGNQHSLDIRTTSSNIVLSDGDGYPRGYYHGGLSSPTWIFATPTTNQNSMQIINSASSNPYGIAVMFTNNNPDDASRYFIVCSGSGNVKFIVYSNGSVLNGTGSYGQLSDEKLKENIVDANSQWDDIKAVKVKNFSFKADKLDKPNMLGVVAQDLEASGMSGLVENHEDVDEDTKESLGTTTKSVKYSILYMKAVKALQEAMTRIEALETKNDALEARIKKLEDG
jgi:hypothetical protein